MFKNSIAPVAIVTIAKDNVEGLRRTIISLLSQKFHDWLLVLVVPRSSVETFKLASSFVDNKRIFLVEDQGIGIYEAMNLATGKLKNEFVWFMNAGDAFYSESALGEGMNLATNLEAQLLIGRHHVIGQKYQEFPGRAFPRRARALKFAFGRRTGCHQAMLFRTQVIRDLGGYSINFRLAADFELVLRIIRQGCAYTVKQTLASVEPGGFSDSNLLRVYSEKHQIRDEVFRSKLISFLSVLWTLLAQTKFRIKEFYALRDLK